MSADQRGALGADRRLLGELGHEVVERDPAYGLAQLEFLQTWLRGIYEESLTVPDRACWSARTRQMAAGGRLPRPAAPAREAARQARGDDRADPRPLG